MNRALFAMCMLVAATACGQVGQRGVNLKVRNQAAGFAVRVSVNHKSGVYKKGEEMKVYVTSSKPGYLYLAYLDASQNAHWLFPNKHQPVQRIPAGQKIHVTKDTYLFLESNCKINVD